MSFEYRSIYRNIYIYIHSFQFTWARKKTWLLSCFFGLYIPPGSYDGIIRIHDIRISTKRPGFPMESIWVFFVFLTLPFEVSQFSTRVFSSFFPLNPVDLSRPKEEVQHFSKVPLIKDEPTEKIRKQKKPWTFCFPDLISVMFSLFFLSRLIERCAAESIHLLAKMYSIFWCSWMHWARLIFVYLPSP